MLGADALPNYPKVLRQRLPCCDHWHLCLVPALLRRSGNVGSLLPRRSSRSKPRTPMSNPRRPVCVCWFGRRGVIESTCVPPTVRAVRPLPRVVIVGAGFAGLQCAKKLGGEPVDVTIVDRH